MGNEKFQAATGALPPLSLLVRSQTEGDSLHCKKRSKSACNRSFFSMDKSEMFSKDFLATSLSKEELTERLKAAD